jgi:hypothetical protein
VLKNAAHEADPVAASRGRVAGSIDAMPETA